MLAPMPANPPLYVRIPKDLHDKAKTEAATRNVSLSAFITRAVDFYLLSNDEFDWQGTKGNGLP